MRSAMDKTQKQNLALLRQKSAKEHDALIRDPEETQTEATYGDRLAARITNAIAVMLPTY